jgi:7-cyano-7-deazaguanine reductase
MAGERFERRYDVEAEAAVTAEVLETLEYAYPGRRTWVDIGTDEFTSVCPWSGLPDFAELHVRYVPRRLLVEMKSLKLYLLQFRNVGILQEHVANRILEDLVALLDPVEMEVEACPTIK